MHTMHFYMNTCNNIFMLVTDRNLIEKISSIKTSRIHGNLFYPSYTKHTKWTNYTIITLFKLQVPVHEYTW